MNILIIYDTYYGNTLKVASFIKDGLSDHSTELMKIDVLTQDKITNSDMVIFGCPTRMFTMTKKIKKSLKKYNYQNKKFWVFDTRAKMDDIESDFLKKLVNKFGYAAEKMESLLEKKGAIKACDYTYYYIKENEGPLYDDVKKQVKKHLELIQF